MIKNIVGSMAGASRGGEAALRAHLQRTDVQQGLRISAIGYVYVQPCICLIGFILNIINIYVFQRKTFCSTPAYMLVLALSIADAITLGLRIPQGLTYYRGSSSVTQTMAIYAYIYATYAEVPITNMTENMSAWLTVCLALERYVAMRHWNFARQYSTRQITKRLIISIALVSVLFNLPYFMIHRIEFKRFANGSMRVITNATALRRSTFYTVYSWFRMTIVQIIPLVFLCILNVLLITIVYQHNKKFGKNTEVEQKGNHLSLGTEGTGADETSLKDTTVGDSQLIQRRQKKRNAQRKLNILLIAVILLFLFGAIPQAFSYIRIFEAFGTCEEAFHYCPTYVVYRMVTTNIALISYGLTFFLYFFLNRHFRNELQKCI
ncbi:G protein coupled receptor fragment [Echinococcus multilocularis]|uniref:G protein coupled receptor n=1 Tax=Echinococcus multilocularis TaxID=6211 RepID=A0A087W1C0_ECHMU|nr:G protein coupled receptor fragment [Echinococcus multilocularis]